MQTLRKEKGLTQEQLAEQFNVSNRTVSRWETGTNMPDISLLVELAEFYSVDICEMIDGERKNGNVNQEEKDTLRKVADYTEKEKDILMKRVCFISIAGLGSLLLALLFVSFGIGQINALFMCIEEIAFGMSIGALITCILFTTGVLRKIRNHDKSRRIAKALRVICPVIIAISILVCMVMAFLNQ